MKLQRFPLAGYQAVAMEDLASSLSAMEVSAQTSRPSWLKIKSKKQVDAGHQVVMSRRDAPGRWSRDTSKVYYPTKHLVHKSGRP